MEILSKMTAIVKYESTGLRFSLDSVTGYFVGIRQPYFVPDKSSGELAPFPTRERDVIFALAQISRNCYRVTEPETCLGVVQDRLGVTVAPEGPAEVQLL